MPNRERGLVWRDCLFFPVSVMVIPAILYYWRHLPPPGYAIGVLGVLAAFVGEMRPWQKSIWLFLITALLILELRAISKDRSDYARAEHERITKEQDQFQNIAGGIKATIEDSDRKYAATISRFEETLNTMTGDGSYCYFTFDFGGAPALIHRGKYTLYDLHANFLDIKQAFIVGTEWVVGSPVTIGDFADGSARLITGVHRPSDINSADRLGLRIFFGARNGFWHEEYRGQYVHGEWVEAIRVFKQRGAPFSKKDVLIFEKIDKHFPRDGSGRAAWN